MLAARAHHDDDIVSDALNETMKEHPELTAAAKLKVAIEARGKRKSVNPIIVEEEEEPVEPETPEPPFKQISTDDYFDKIIDAFNEFSSMCREKTKHMKYEDHFIIDCANGIAAAHMKTVMARVSEHISPTLINAYDIELDDVNNKCGAAYVQAERMEPFGYLQHMPDKVVCFSGDADRLIYMKRSFNNPVPVIMDGDKIFGLIMLYIKT